MFRLGAFLCAFSAECQLRHPCLNRRGWSHQEKVHRRILGKAGGYRYSSASRSSDCRTSVLTRFLKMTAACVRQRGYRTSHRGHGEPQRAAELIRVRRRLLTGFAWRLPVPNFASCFRQAAQHSSIVQGDKGLELPQRPATRPPKTHEHTRPPHTGRGHIVTSLLPQFIILLLFHVQAVARTPLTSLTPLFILTRLSLRGSTGHVSSVLYYKHDR